MRTVSVLDLKVSDVVVGCGGQNDLLITHWFSREQLLRNTTASQSMTVVVR